MLNLNVCHIAGNITREPELKFTPKGTAVCQIGLAVNRVYYVGEGNGREKREEVLFLDCEFWGKTAETVAKHCGKGHNIMVEGHLKQESWDDKATGAKRSKLKLSVDQFHFVSSPRKDDEPPAQRKSRPAPASEPEEPMPEELQPDDSEEVPF